MALINPGPSGEMAGTIGGTTYARNRSGAYARSWAKPINPNTAAQSVVRANFGYGSSMWGLLTMVQRQSWNDYAAGVTRLNRFGQSYVPSGRQIFMELAANAMAIASPPPTVPPITPTLPGLAISGASIVTDAGPPITIAELNLLDVAITNAGTATLIVYATPLQPASRTNFKRYLRQITVRATAGGTEDFAADFNALYGTPTISTTMQFVGLAARVIDNVTFLGSAKLYFAA